MQHLKIIEFSSIKQQKCLLSYGSHVLCLRRSKCRGFVEISRSGEGGNVQRLFSCLLWRVWSPCEGNWGGGVVGGDRWTLHASGFRIFALLAWMKPVCEKVQPRYQRYWKTDSCWGIRRFDGIHDSVYNSSTPVHILDQTKSDHTTLT